MAATPSVRLIKRPAWFRPEHPVYRLESRRRTQSRAVNALQMGCLPAILGVAGITVAGVIVFSLPQQIAWSVENAIMQTLALIILALLIVQALGGAMANILMVAQTAPLISGEVELQSWGLLRTTMVSLREIVLAKYAATLAALRGTLAGLVIVRGISTVTGIVLALAVALRQIFYYMSLSDWARMIRTASWVPPMTALAIFFVWYAAQPVVQYLLNGALGMLASAMTRSRGRALAVGLTARLGGWVMSITLNVGMLYFLGYLILGNWSSPQYAPLAFFHNLPTPSPEAVTAVVSLTTIIYVLVVAALQAGFIVVALRLVERRARRMGG